MVNVDEIRAVAMALPRSSEGFVRGEVKFRIGRIVYLSISRDGSTMGFAFPKEWRNALVESEPTVALAMLKEIARRFASALPDS